MSWKKSKPDLTHVCPYKASFKSMVAVRLALDNQATISKINCPELALYGELDTQVKPDENFPFVEDALIKGENKKFEIKKLPGLNHLFQHAITGSEYEYFRIEETISPDVLELIGNWIRLVSP